VAAPVWWWVTFNLDDWTWLNMRHDFFKFIIQSLYLVAWASYTIGLLMWALKKGYF
jgi:hypothetical protein